MNYEEKQELVLSVLTCASAIYTNLSRLIAIKNNLDQIHFYSKDYIPKKLDELFEKEQIDEYLYTSVNQALGKIKNIDADKLLKTDNDDLIRLCKIVEAANQDILEEIEECLIPYNEDTRKIFERSFIEDDD